MYFSLRAPRSLAIAALLAAGCARKPPPAAPAAPPVDTVAASDARGAIEQWREAYEVRSMDALARLYARDPGLAVVLDGSLQLGWPAVEAALRQRLARALEIHVRLRDLQVTPLGTDAASAVAAMTRETADATTTVSETGIVTLVLRRTDAGWVIVAEHYSYKRP